MSEEGASFHSVGEMLEAVHLHNLVLVRITHYLGFGGYLNYLGCWAIKFHRIIRVIGIKVMTDVRGRLAINLCSAA